MSERQSGYGAPPPEGLRRVQRFRRNDYVGPAIWGFNIDFDLRVGDYVYEDDDLMKRRWYFIAGTAEGGEGTALALYWADKSCYWHRDEPTCRERFCGFVDRDGRRVRSIKF